MGCEGEFETAAEGEGRDSADAGDGEGRDGGEGGAEAAEEGAGSETQAVMGIGVSGAGVGGSNW